MDYGVLAWHFWRKRCVNEISSKLFLKWLIAELRRVRRKKLMACCSLTEQRIQMYLDRLGYKKRYRNNGNATLISYIKLISLFFFISIFLFFWWVPIFFFFWWVPIEVADREGGGGNRHTWAYFYFIKHGLMYWLLVEWQMRAGLWGGVSKWILNTHQFYLSNIFFSLFCYRHSYMTHFSSISNSFKVYIGI